MTIRIVLVDDQEIVRAGLHLLLQSQTDMDIVGEAGDSDEALALCRQVSPHVAITTIELPGQAGLEFTRKLKVQNPATAVLALTIHEDPQHFFEMIRAGASGYVPRRAATSDLVTAIRTVHAGQVYVHPSIAQALAEGYRRRAQGSHDKLHSGDLEPHELQVLEMIAQGAQNKEIAARLGVNVRTVARYRASIQSKLNLHSQADLVRYAVDKGLVSLDHQITLG
jgi:two-component system response regulator NreC